MAEPQEIPIALYIAVGRIVVNWAYVEMALNQCISVIYKRCDGKTINKSIPASLSRKTGFLKRAFSELTMLAAFALDGLALTTRVTNIAEARNRPTHAAFIGYDANTGSFHFRKLDHNEKTIKLIDSKRTYLQLEKNGKDILVLAEDCARFANKLARHFSKTARA